MTRPRERYRNVWQRGYEAGMDAAHAAVVEALSEGVHLAPQGFDTHGIAVRSADRSRVAVVGSIGALRHVLERWRA